MTRERIKPKPKGQTRRIATRSKTYSTSYGCYGELPDAEIITILSHVAPVDMNEKYLDGTDTATLRRLLFYGLELHPSDKLKIQDKIKKHPFGVAMLFE